MAEKIQVLPVKGQTECEKTEAGVQTAKSSLDPDI